jgi:hypothetical protein
MRHEKELTTLHVFDVLDALQLQDSQSWEDGAQRMIYYDLKGGNVYGKVSWWL